MNIDDVEEVRVEGDVLKAIFARQRNLMNKYHVIEEKSGIGYALVTGDLFDINNQKWQYLCKDFAWRITEELTEACEAYAKNDFHHAKEELSDALHFATELCLICKIYPEEIGKFEDLFREPCVWWQPVYHLGLAMNCLKLKPWKQTHVLTDSVKYKNHVIDAYRKLLGCAVLLKSNKEEFPLYYFKKAEVNAFRQRSNY
ncbi:MAG: dUTP diphosphatase [Dehalococcoidales bacterium]|jgi:hypothetical protein|nr:dUTP diphosphatase [Dehalococcoidales bacterium]